MTIADGADTALAEPRGAAVLVALTAPRGSMVDDLNGLVGWRLFCAEDEMDAAALSAAVRIEIADGTSPEQALAAALKAVTLRFDRQAAFSAGLSRSLVALRREYFELARSLAAIDDFVDATHYLPRAEPTRVGSASSMIRLSGGERHSVTLRGSTKGLCGVAVEASSDNVALVAARLTAVESALTLGVWTFRIDGDAGDQILSLGRGLTVDEAACCLEFEVLQGSLVLTAAPPAFDVQAEVTGLPEAVVRRYRWVPGLRLPGGWGVLPGDDASAGAAEPGRLTWPSAPEFWSALKRPRRLFSEPPSTEADGSRVSSRLDYVQVHPLPGRVVLTSMPVPPGHDLELAAFLGHDAAPDVEVWAGLCRSTVLRNGVPSEELLAEIRGGLRALRGRDDVERFELPAVPGSEVLVVASSVQDGRSTEYAWVRFEAPRSQPADVSSPDAG